jgi:hypothetical protein
LPQARYSPAKPWAACPFGVGWALENRRSAALNTLPLAAKACQNRTDLRTAGWFELNEPRALFRSICHDRDFCALRFRAEEGGSH